MIQVEIDTSRLEALFERLAKAAASPAPAMRAVAGVMLDAVEENFVQEGRPRWLGLKPGYRTGGRILNNTGRLAGSLVKSSDATGAQVKAGNSEVKYAAIHQFGGQTRPHLIVARNAKALKFGNRYAKSVKHPGSKIPARPFLKLMPEDEAEIEFTVSNYLRQVIER
ncbi:phage virion morphogenesis protein [Chitinibacter sp. ZOR0017]|uniref:phage virion morphogenesis protein n=1 Tax=Chitinibacter sp. ZOR0017 TaxID=1339254 RepID=UPI00064848CB|nr:phage virion morphogenesis protein [Chitinibacter sp. ZOR0017]